MSFGEELALYCIISGIASGIISIIIGRNKVKDAIKLKNFTEIKSDTDVKKSLFEMYSVIYRRMNLLGLSFIQPGKGRDTNVLETLGADDFKPSKFFRMAHAAGLEIVLRPRKEGRPGGGEEEEEGYVSASRQSDYAC